MHGRIAKTKSDRNTCPILVASCYTWLVVVYDRSFWYEVEYCLLHSMPTNKRTSEEVITLLIPHRWSRHCCMVFITIYYLCIFNHQLLLFLTRAAASLSFFFFFFFSSSSLVVVVHHAHHHDGRSPHLY